MRDPIASMYDKIILALDPAGRDRTRIDRALNLVKADLLKQAGHKQTEWFEEYYAYLLEVYKQALDLALVHAVSKEEYEWAGRIKKQIDRLIAEEPAENKVTKVF